MQYSANLGGRNTSFHGPPSDSFRFANQHEYAKQAVPNDRCKELVIPDRSAAGDCGRDALTDPACGDASVSPMAAGWYPRNLALHCIINMHEYVRHSNTRKQFERSARVYTTRTARMAKKANLAETPGRESRCMTWLCVTGW